MLTTDLARVRLNGNVVEPRFIGVSNGDLRKEARGLIELHKAHEGKSVGELEEALADHIGDSPRFLVQRGMSKLLMDKAKLVVHSATEPALIREVVFRLSAEKGPIGVSGSSRKAIIREAAESLKLTPDAVESSLYADLKSEERLESIENIDVTTLLHRYNMATAQTILLRAQSLHVELEGLSAKELRFLFRSLKFHRLMHRVIRKKGRTLLDLDGPLSMFNHTTRYGLGLALFLPNLCLFENWKLTAQLLWGKDRRTMTFHLDGTQGLKTEARMKGTWEGKEELHFRAAFRALKSPWTLRRSTRVITLSNNEVLIPDYELVHEDGRKALLDIVWYWRAKSIEKKLSQRNREAPKNLVTAIATRLKADRSAAAPESLGVYGFKGVIQPKALLSCADQVATREIKPLPSETKPAQTQS